MMSFGSRNLTTLSLILIGFLSGQAMADPNLPWTLRNHYSIPLEEGVIIYAEDNGEWRVLMKDGTILANGIGFSIGLADGTELTGLNLGDGSPSRDSFAHELGDGTTYSVTFAPKNGLKVKHILRTFKARPFVFVEIEVENVGTADVSITNIRPVFAETSVMQALSPQTRIHYRRMREMGGQPVVVSEKDAMMVVINDPTKSFCLGLGMMPAGPARSSISFRESKGEWHGDIICRYEPMKILAPGETLASDPLWMSNGVPESHRVDLYYAWSYSMYVDNPKSAFTARGWYTLTESNGLDDYRSSGSGWKGVGIDHVLLGRGWEGRPGSFQGAAPRFPKNMKSAVDALTGDGLQVGLTIDPLVAEAGGQSWTFESSDGQAWLNPGAPEAIKAIGDKLSTLKGMGAAFIVVDMSLIPDAALEAFRLTRAEAQNLAFKALRDGADPLTVFPASSALLRDDVNDWLDAGSAVARMAIYGVNPAPIRCDFSNGSDITEDLGTAVSFWPGPIEFQGNVTRRLSDELGGMIRRARVAGQPMDAEMSSPRTWQVQDYDGEGKLTAERTVSVGGALATQVSNIVAPEATTPAS